MWKENKIIFMAMDVSIAFVHISVKLMSWNTAHESIKIKKKHRSNGVSIGLLRKYMISLFTQLKRKLLFIVLFYNRVTADKADSVSRTFHSGWEEQKNVHHCLPQNVYNRLRPKV